MPEAPGRREDETSTPTSQRRDGSGWASGPVQMAATMAARLIP